MSDLKFYFVSAEGIWWHRQGGILTELKYDHEDTNTHCYDLQFCRKIYKTPEDMQQFKVIIANCICRVTSDISSTSEFRKVHGIIRPHVLVNLFIYKDGDRIELATYHYTTYKVLEASECLTPKHLETMYNGSLLEDCLQYGLRMSLSFNMITNQNMSDPKTFYLSDGYWWHQRGGTLTELEYDHEMKETDTHCYNLQFCNKIYKTPGDLKCDFVTILEMCIVRLTMDVYESLEYREAHGRTCPLISLNLFIYKNGKRIELVYYPYMDYDALVGDGLLSVKHLALAYNRSSIYIFLQDCLQHGLHVCLCFDVFDSIA